MSVALANTAQIVPVPFQDLVLWPGNPRRRIDEGGLRELADDMAAQGVLQNLLGRRRIGGRKRQVEIVCGQRRWRAAQRLVEAGTWLPETPLPVCIRDLDDHEALRVAIGENVQREDMSPFEEGEAVNRLRLQGDTVESIAGRLARSPRWVREREGLYLRAARETREAFDDGHINLGQAGALIIGEADRQAMILARIGQGEQWDAARIRAEMSVGLPRMADARFEPSLYKGALRRDLFHDHSYAEDRDEFHRLQRNAADYIAARYAGPGRPWSWAEVQDGGSFARWDYLPEDGPPETAGVVVHIRAGDLKVVEYTGLVRRQPPALAGAGLQAGSAPFGRRQTAGLQMAQRESLPLARTAAAAAAGRDRFFAPEHLAWARTERIGRLRLALADRPEVAKAVLVTAVAGDFGDLFDFASKEWSHLYERTIADLRESENPWGAAELFAAIHERNGDGILAAAIASVFDPRPPVEPCLGDEPLVVAIARAAEPAPFDIDARYFERLDDKALRRAAYLCGALSAADCRGFSPMARGDRERFVDEILLSPPPSDGWQPPELTFESRAALERRLAAADRELAAVSSGRSSDRRPTE